MILARTEMEIPIYLGLLISVPTLLLTWGFLVSTISKYVGTRRSSPSQSRENQGTPEFFLRYKVTDGVLLGISTAVAVLIRAIPLVIGSMPTGFDTAYYIGTLQSSEKLSWPKTAWHRDTPIAYLILTIMGAVMRIARPLPVYQVKFVELLPVAFHALSAVAVYGLVKEATKSSRSAVLASFLTSSAFSQLRMSFDLYKNIIGIAVLAFCFKAYLLLIRKKGKRHFVVTLILLCSLLGIHPYPALILILTLSTYALGTYLLSSEKEEYKHAMKFFSYIIETGGKVELGTIDSVPTDYTDVEEALKEAIKHEEHITNKCKELMDLAQQKKEYYAYDMLNWFIQEQIEEENLFTQIYDDFLHAHKNLGVWDHHLKHP